MKAIMIGLISVFIGCAAAADTIVKTSVDLKNTELIKLVEEAIEANFKSELEPASDKVFLSYTTFPSHTLIEVTKDSLNSTTAIKVRSEVNAGTTDYEFSDPVEEIEVVCDVDLVKNKEGLYEVSFVDCDGGFQINDPIDGFWD